jgi:hypothetical protein
VRLHLPSGATCELDPDRARAARLDTAAPPIARDVAILSTPGVVRARRDGQPIEVADLALADLHLLRIVLVQREVVEEAAIEVACENCDAAVSVSPSRGVELGPFRDDELDDPELDAPFDFDADHAIPPVRVGRARARTMRLVPRTVGEARALWSRDTDQPLHLSPAIVAAMGVHALGEERRASVLSRALARATDDAWDAVCAIWEDANGHPRLVSTVRCEACGANVVVDAPAVRELGPTGGSSTFARSSRGASWDADAFEQMVRRHADVAYRKLRVRNIDLVVDEGVPAVDDGGEPLLGCYTPPQVDPDLAIERPPEVRLFARSFRAEVDADPTFDLEGEVRETIEHELEHHLHFLSGHDPMDEEERDAIVVERRRQVGRRESTRRGVRALGADLVGFLRVGWPLLVIGAVAAWLGRCAN